MNETVLFFLVFFLSKKKKQNGQASKNKRFPKEKEKKNKIAFVLCLFVVR